VADLACQLSEGDKAAEQLILLPMNAYLEESDQQRIAAQLQSTRR